MKLMPLGEWSGRYNYMPWEIFDRFYNAHWFLTGYSCRYFSELLQEGGSKSITTFVGLMEKDVNSMIFDVRQFNSAGDYYADKLINDHAWRKRMYRRHHSDLKRYFVMAESLRKLPFSKMTDKQIFKVVDPVIKLQERVRILGVMLNGLVLDGRGHLSNKLRTEISRFFNDNKDFDKLWALLTQVTRLSMRQQRELEIAKLAKAREPLNKKISDLKKIYQKYCWLDYMYYGPPATWQDYQQELRAALQNNIKSKLKVDLQKLSRDQRSLMERYKFNNRAKHLVWLAQQVLWQKGWRKDVEYHGFYSYEPMFREIAKRKGEKDWRNLLYMFPWELESFILYTRPTPKELSDRRAYSILIVKGPKYVKLLTGNAAKKYYKTLDIKDVGKGLKGAKGQCAFAGKAGGMVKIVQVPSDMHKMKRGDILVSQATSPDLLPAMKKAAAIVTNTGGLICHAAITARELKIPCVVGTTNATLVFKDGDKVEVDATKGIVRKVK